VLRQAQHERPAVPEVFNRPAVREVLKQHSVQPVSTSTFSTVRPELVEGQSRKWANEANIREKTAEALRFEKLSTNCQRLVESVFL
jgi:hypothetical protein